MNAFLGEKRSLLLNTGSHFMDYTMLSLIFELQLKTFSLKACPCAKAKDRLQVIIDNINNMCKYTAKDFAALPITEQGAYCDKLMEAGF